MAIDTDRLQEFLGRLVGDLGATFAAGTVVIGHRLGLYRALAAEPATAERLGTWLVVEPFAADDVAGNLNPIGRVYYNASTQLCVPNALSQPGGHALGAQAGEPAIRELAAQAGFTRFRRAAQRPFHLVYEVRP